ncbi:MAG TPA: cysteine--tRNA ligase [Streptosporangiaceae bacterium]|nr:cysteine--tRNA ligase [Streptosporangiaceae bacterium]
MGTGYPLRLYNSLDRTLQGFEPAGDRAGIYSCGPTVYSFPHLGNMRPYVFADTLRRALRWKGIPARHVINITDVGHAVADSDTGEDKLEVAAAKEQRRVQDIATFYTDAYFKDIAALNILPADEYPRASAYVEDMIEFAKQLEKNGYAYQIDSGLYFDTSKSPGYGTLAQIDVEGQQEAARVEQVPGRRHKTDFALWRAEEPGKQRVMRWESPWGPGAPGWHLECSVMSMKLLGEHFDIHTGGVDHRELHHVNEIAQSEAYLNDGARWVNVWMHNEFLQLNDQKMAKSAGGAPRLADLVEAGYHPMAFRLFLLGGHYRSQLDFTPQAMDAAQATLKRLVSRVEPLQPLPPIETLAQAQVHAPAGVVARYVEQMDAAISVDLATPRLLAVLQDALKDQDLDEAGRKTAIAAADGLLGLSLSTLRTKDLKARAAAELTETERAAIERLVADRTEARKAKDWDRADQIRAELDARGVDVTDTQQGPVWELR